MLDISIKQLETFVATAECRSFTRAAEQLYLTQSTVSAHISTLEQILGTCLILRGARKKVTLTEDGKRIYAAAKDILTRCRDLQDMVTETDSEELAIGASTAPGQYILPELMSAFIEKEPGCRYLMKKGDSMQVHRMLDRGDVRLGFVGAVADRTSYTYRVITEDRLVLITPDSEKYRRAKAEGTAGKDLLFEPMIVREENSGTRRAMDAYLRRNHISKDELNVVACMENPEAIKNSVVRGLGVSVVSELAVRNNPVGMLVFDLEAEGVFRKIYAVWRKDTVFSRTEQKFLNFIKSEIPLLLAE